MVFLWCSSIQQSNPMRSLEKGSLCILLKGHAYSGTTIFLADRYTAITSDFLLSVQRVSSNLFKSAKGVVFDEAIIAVLSASLIAPFILPRINGVLDSVPILRDHKSLASLLAGMIVFGIANGVKMPAILKAVTIGIAGAFILVAVIPLYTSVTNRGVGN
jgi:hypothetical protein